MPGDVGRQAAPVSFGARLSELRRQRRLSLRTLARLTHYSHTYLWLVEIDQRQATLELAVLLDRALKSDTALRDLVSNAVGHDQRFDVDGSAYGLTVIQYGFSAE